MSRKADHEEAHRRHDVFNAVNGRSKLVLVIHDLDLVKQWCVPEACFSQQRLLRVREKTAGLFYSFTSLDHSDSSMLVSAGFEGHHPLTNW